MALVFLAHGPPILASSTWKSPFDEGEAEYGKGNFAGAAKCYQEAVFALRNHPTEKSNLASCLDSLGWAYRKLDRLADAESCFREGLKIRESAFGDSHPDTIASCKSLTLLLFKQNRYEECEPFCRRALKADELKYGRRSIDASNWQWRLAAIVEKKNPAETISLYKECLSILEEKYGKESPKVLDSISLLAYALQNSGSYEEAVQLLYRCLEIEKKTKGANDVAVASRLTEIAYGFELQKKHTQSISVSEEALEIYRSLEGDNGKNVAEALKDIGNNYFDQGRFIQAESAQRKALAICRLDKEISERTRISAIMSLAHTLHELGMHEESEKLFREALSRQERIYPGNDLELGISYHNISRSLRSQKRYAEAELLMRKSLAIKEQNKIDDFDRAASIRNLARLAELQGRYDEAGTLFKQCIALYEKDSAKNSSYICINKISLGGSYIAQGKYLDAEALLLPIAKKFGTSGANNAFVQAASSLRFQRIPADEQQNGRIKVASGRESRDYARVERDVLIALKADPLSPSMSQFENVLQLQDEKSLSESLPRVETLIQMAVQFKTLDANVSSLINRCYELLESRMESKPNRTRSRVSNRGSAKTASSLAMLADLFASNSQFERAETVLSWAEEMIANDTKSSAAEVVESYLALGSSWELLAEPARAQKSIERALVLAPKNAPLKFKVLVARAQLLQELSEFKLARDSSEDALRLGQSLHGKDSSQLFSCYRVLVETDLALGRSSEAHEYAKLAFRLSNLGTQEKARSILLVGQSCLALNKIEEAEENFHSVLSMMKEDESSDVQVAGEASNYLGECFLRFPRENQYRAAESYFAQSLKLDNIDTSARGLLNKSRDLDGLALVAHLVSTRTDAKKMSGLESSLGNPEIARNYALNSAACIDKYIGKAFPDLSFAQKCAFISVLKQQQNSLLTVCSGPSTLREAYGYMMKWKGLLLESLRERELLSGAAADKPQLKNLYDKLVASRRKLAGLSNRSKDDDDGDAARRLEELSNTNDSLERQLSLGVKLPLNDPLANMDASQFIRLLKTDEIFVDIIRYRQFGQKEDSYCAVVIDGAASGAMHFVDLGRVSEVASLVRDWRAATTGNSAYQQREVLVKERADESSKGDPGSYDLVTEKLGNLLTPIFDSIKADPTKPDPTSRRLWLCPEGDFARVPWNAVALLSGKNRWQICEVDSPREFALLRGDKRVSFERESSVLLAGLSDFSKSGLPSIPGALREVQELQTMASSCKRPVKTLTQKEATKAGVVGSIGGKSIVHIATHGFARSAEAGEELNSRSGLRFSSRSGAASIANSRNPLLDCGLYLYYPEELRVQKLDEAPDVLTADELVSLKLNQCDLVTLSACQTGLGRGLDGQGVIGLRSAILAAGARCVLMSLWSVDDESSRELMKRFYSYLWKTDSDVSQVEALRRAQEDIRAIPRWREPRYWAGWVLAGDGWSRR